MKRKIIIRDWYITDGQINGRYVDLPINIEEINKYCSIDNYKSYYIIEDIIIISF